MSIKTNAHSLTIGRYAWSLLCSSIDRNESSVLSAGRCDLLVDTGDGLLLKDRTIEIDEAVLRTQNLAVFL